MTLIISTGVLGRSLPSVGVFSIACTTSMPAMTLPNTYVSGPVETVFEVGDGARAWAGHADDPFFFDAQGYLEGLDTAAVSFMSTRDFLAGLNVTAAAIEINTALLQDGDNPMQFWVTAARKG